MPVEETIIPRVSNADEVTLTKSGLIMSIKPLGVSAGYLAADAVETLKIADAQVTAAKLADDAKGALRLIATQTLASDAVTITFAAIPAGYTTLKLVGRLIANTATETENIRMNGLSTNTYAYENLIARSTTVTCTTSGAVSWWTLHGLAATANVPVYFEAEIINLNGLSKAIFARTHIGGTTFESIAGQNSTTAEISQLDVISNEANGLKAGSTVSLFGFKG